MKSRKLIAILLAAVTAFAAAGCGKTNSDTDKADAAATESGKKVLKVGMEGTYAPYTYHDTDGNLVGYEVDVANAIGDYLGWDVEFVETEWDSMFEALNAGNFDVIMNQVTMTDERQENYDFSTPYIYSKPVLIVKSDNEDIKSFEDIAGKKAAEGLTSNFNQIAKDYGAEIVGQDEFSLAMECVISGEADCAINDELTYAYWQTVKGDTESTKVVAESDDVTSSAIVMKKGNTELKADLDKAIDALLADGTIAKISEKYFSTDISTK